jgi:hypothetical protein
VGEGFVGHARLNAGLQRAPERADLNPETGVPIDLAICLWASYPGHSLLQEVSVSRTATINGETCLATIGA